MTVEIVRRGAAKRYPKNVLREMAEMVLRALKKTRVELSIALVGDSEMRRLNTKYRKKTTTTDVLSFPSGQRLPSGAILLGDVVISIDQAKRQAGEGNRPLKSEVASLLIHGVLHLLGYDHERSQRQAKIMGALERRLLSYLCRQGLLEV